MLDHDASRYDNEVTFDRPNNPHSFALQLIGANQRVLELGCAVGHVTERLAEAGNTVVGVEIDATAAERARLFAEKVHVIDLDHVALSTVEPGPFDVIYAGDLLEHLSDPHAALADLVTMLAPDGRLIISIPNVAHADIRLMLLEGRWQYRDVGLLDHTHQRWFTREGVRELLTSVGFTATKVERVQHEPGATEIFVDPSAHSQETLDLIAADPEYRTYQFVVEARRTSTNTDDALARQPVQLPEPNAVRKELDALHAHAEHLAAHNTALEERATALQNEVDAWNNSTIAKLITPLRSIRQRLHGGR